MGQDVLQLIEMYINRNTDEEEQIALKNSIGQRSSSNRQNASRADVLRISREKDTNDFIGCGIDTVDFLSKEAMIYFKKWDGEIRMVPNIKLRRFTKATLESGTVTNENSNVLLKEDIMEDNDENGEEEEEDNSVEDIEEGMEETGEVVEGVGME